MKNGYLDDMTWKKFEDYTKQIIVEKQQDKVEEEDIPMEVNDANVKKTRHISEKLDVVGGL